MNVFVTFLNVFYIFYVLKILALSSFFLRRVFYMRGFEKLLIILSYVGSEWRYRSKPLHYHQDRSATCEVDCQTSWTQCRKWPWPPCCKPRPTYSAHRCLVESASHSTSLKMKEKRNLWPLILSPFVLIHSLIIGYPLECQTHFYGRNYVTTW